MDQVVNGAEAAPVAIPESNKYQVKIAGRVVDLRQALPLTTGDFKALAKNPDEGLRLTPKHMAANDYDFDRISGVVLHAVRKVDPSITMEDVDTLSLTELSRVFALAMEAGENDRADHPTSRTSSSSPKPGAGDQATWTG